MALGSFKLRLCQIMSMKKTDDQVDFGFQRVPAPEKTHLVQDVFRRVAQQYDLMNDVMSLGIHRCWKGTFVEHLPLVSHSRILDMAGGTGDITRRICQRVMRQKRVNVQVVLADLNEKMLQARGQEASPLYDQKNLWQRQVTVSPLCVNAETLVFPDDTFHLYTIAFGLRNITDQSLALREAYRVLKKGGSFFCLEFSKVHTPVLSHLYRRYLLDVIPRIGKRCASDEAAYQYLAESIEKFADQETLGKMIRAAGFQHVTYTNLSLGMVAIHQGWKF